MAKKRKQISKKKVAAKKQFNITALLIWLMAGILLLGAAGTSIPLALNLNSGASVGSPIIPNTTDFRVIHGNAKTITYVSREKGT
jgi:hypothetical protein